MSFGSYPQAINVVTSQSNIFLDFREKKILFVKKNTMVIGIRKRHSFHIESYESTKMTTKWQRRRGETLECLKCTTRYNANLIKCENMPLYLVEVMKS